MSTAPILLFLHGVDLHGLEKADQNEHWEGPLRTALNRIGYVDFDSAQVIAPKYSHALNGWDVKEALPQEILKPLAGDAAKKNRRDFERRMGAVEYRLGRHELGVGWAGGDAIVDAGIPVLKQAHNYLSDPQIRAHVLNRILSELPKSGQIVIVGHSLGSVIAADLLRRLPLGIQVTGLVTIGSPLANGRFDVDQLRGALREPPTNLGWWINFWNVPDIVAAHRGVSSVFPWLVDFKINTRPLDLLAAHSAATYLSNDAVATAIGFALFGSLTTALAKVERGVVVPTDATERVVLLALRYAHLIKRGLKPDLRDRFTGALRNVQAATIKEVEKRVVENKRGMPSELGRLAFDLSDPDVELPEPLPAGHVDREEAVVLLTVLAAENIIRPFEIGLPDSVRLEAMRELTAEMGLGSAYGTHVFEAAKQARKVLSGNQNLKWVRIGAIGAGAVAIAVATGGLALAAGAGLAGAAAVTSALAAFGPGGMIGGLLTAGTLVTAGGGGIVFGLASSGTTAEALEAIVERRLATVILRKKLDLDPDATAWSFLTEIEIEVRREHERVDEFSDDSSNALKELKRKIESVERALRFLSEEGLEPAAGL